MNINKLKKVGTGPKPHLKSLRLRNSAVQAIGRICKVTGLSANEIINRTVEALGAESRLLEDIDNRLIVNDNTITVATRTNIGYLISFDIKKVTNTFGQGILYNVKHRLTYLANPEYIQENEFVLESIKDLLDFGFSSNYEIYVEQPKLEESE